MEAKRKRDGRGATVEISVPAGDSSLYRHEATDPLLHFLVDNPYGSYSIRELGRITDYSHPAIKNAVEALEANNVVDAVSEGNKIAVSINRDRLTKPDDPVLQIPQTEFQEPVREATDRIQQELPGIHGIAVFGSVARGSADRQSDIDLWVLVQEERPTNQRKANEIAKEIGQKEFGEDRYEIQVLVEDVGSALDYGERLEDVLSSSITLVDSDTFRNLKQEVLEDAE